LSRSAKAEGRSLVLGNRNGNPNKKLLLALRALARRSEAQLPTLRWLQIKTTCVEEIYIAQEFVVPASPPCCGTECATAGFEFPNSRRSAKHQYQSAGRLLQ
jgi:hypothetical protein